MKLCHSIGLQCSAGIAECFAVGAAIPIPTQGLAILILYCPVDVVSVFLRFLLLVFN